ncbi:hypothetical protein AB0K60_18640 [Thermopolyspora sp. NPDC052614]|uniref:hypothetical protein n=1 Tax=Thermopolyspora sp. NPDC052614 TaxID=3155682 RepID=UPI0034280F2C
MSTELSTGTADLEVACAIPGEEPQHSVNYVTVSAPARVAAGDKTELRVTLRSKAATPRDLAAREVTAELSLQVDGPDGGQVLTVTGLTNPDPIPRGERVFLDEGVVTFVPAAAGTYAFTPGDHTVVTSDHPVVCAVTGGSAVAARTEAR